MRGNHATLWTKLGSHGASGMTAVADLKAFQIIADEHAAGLKKLIPVFETLYAAMPAAQQSRVDHVFAEHQRYGNM